MKSQFSRWVPVALAIGIAGGFASAQQMVTANQGAPGQYGPWPVDVGTGTVTVPAQVRLRDSTGTTLTRVYADGDARGTVSGPPLIADDGTNMQSVMSDTSGRLMCVGPAAAGAAATGNPLLCGGTDGTNARATLLDTGGRPQVNITDDTDVMLVDSSGNGMTSLGTQIAGENIGGTRSAIANWMEIYKAGTYSTNPNKTTTAIGSNATACVLPGGASCTIIYASTEWINWPNLTLTIKETVGTNPITNVIVEWSPDGTSFEAWDATTFAGLPAGSIKSLAISGNSRRYLRVEAQSASGSTADVWVTASQN